MMAINKEGLSRTILAAAATAIFAAVIGSYLDMSRDLAETKAAVDQAVVSIRNVENRLKTMDDADAVTAADETARLKSEVLELQQQQRKSVQ